MRRLIHIDFDPIDDRVRDSRQRGVAACVTVFIGASPFRRDPQYSRSITAPLTRPTADTFGLVRAALVGLHAIYREGFNFARVGAMLLDLSPDSSLAGPGPMSLNQDQQLELDQAAWEMRQQRRTPAYTTDIADIPVVRA